MQSKGSIEIRIKVEVIPYVPDSIKVSLAILDKSILSEIEEIRLRAGKPVMLTCHGKDLFLLENGQVSHRAQGAIIPNMDDLSNMVYRVCENSWYAYQDDINRGFITIRGGHRIGLVGTPVIEQEKIINIRDISSLNIRIAREVLDCGEKVVKHLVKGNRDIYNTLIISPPGAGKTTLLRDIIRLISNGFDTGFSGLKVGVIDERGELAACCRGIAQNNLGWRTDVIHGVHKKEGMEILLRSMSPNVIAMDELGNTGDVSSIMQVMNAGVRIIATAHGYDAQALAQRQGFQMLFQEQAFERFLVISADCNLNRETKVLDGEGNVLAVDFQNNRKPLHRGELNDGRICIFPAAYRKDRNSAGNTGIFDGPRE